MYRNPLVIKERILTKAERAFLYIHITPFQKRITDKLQLCLSSFINKSFFTIPFFYFVIFIVNLSLYIYFSYSDIHYHHLIGDCHNNIQGKF
jgi:hypothetical protein